MNISKRLLTTVAAATAVATLTAVTVGATGIGYSDGDIVESEKVAIELSATDPTEAVVELPTADLTVDVTIPAGVFDVEWVDFNAVVIENADVISALQNLDSSSTVKDSKAIDLFFTDHNTGDVLDATGKDIVVTIKNVGNCNTLFYYNPETKSLEDVNATFADGNVTFTAPHFSTYVLAEIVDNNNGNNNNNGDNNGKPADNNNDDGKGVLTGDASATLIIVVSAIAVAALATVVVTSKAKKSSK